MEVFQAVVSDLVSQLISRLIRTHQERENFGQKLRRMQLMLISIHASIVEAEQRFITNHMILLQLKTFTEILTQGYYLYDSLESRGTDEDIGQDEVRNVYTFSAFSPCKRIRRMSNCVKRLLLGDMSNLQEVMGLLEAVVANLREFNASLVAGYARRPRRPYDSYMYADKCMFGRHVEREKIIIFLLEKDDESATQTLPVLPIIGRHRSGKKTLMENVCSDERVHNHFSMVSVLDGDDLEGEMLEAPLSSWNEGVLITNHDLQLKRCLFVIEFAFSVDDESWKKFYNRASNQMKGSGSKIVLISSLKEAARLGTSSPITLMPLHPELFWYFFKAIAFGSVDPKEHPRLLYLGMHVAAGAQLHGGALRENLDVDAWSAILRFVKKIRKGHAYSKRRGRVISLHSICRTEISHSCIFRRSRMDVNGKIPELSLSDLRSANVPAVPPGKKFEVVLLRSCLPPYRIYVGTYVILDASAVKTRPFVSNETLDDMEDKMFRLYQPTIRAE